METKINAQNPFNGLIDLVSERIGGRALLTNDDFFASKNNLVKSTEPVFIPGKYTSKGKWMDGWESRRRRTPGFDWCILKLGIPGKIQGVNVSTMHFTGNYPEHFSLEAAYCPKADAPSNLLKSSVKWVELIGKTALKSSCDNFFSVSNEQSWTHVRLNIFPDGGVARLRLYGEVTPDWEKLRKTKTPFDLSAIANGAKVITCNDNFYGPMNNLILPGRAVNMGDGWETQRKRVPGHDWIVVKLGTTGLIRKIEVDTNHFKGNYPDTCSIEGCAYPERNLTPEQLAKKTDLKWVEILPQTKLKAHFRHYFDKALTEAAKKNGFDYVRLNIFPDGGISRLRVHGLPFK
ncbi:MAG: allantoicase [Proteobacteria bacterium]|nr:allantoicase [Pseudomonadota bacterium]NDD03791.1 allantoicase [Pseudomonadota bacterium]NDG25911.1 allantoicase [Pseudomonadota bacterium]